MKKLKNGKENKNGKGDDCWIPKVCSVCDSHLEEDAGDIAGYFGILPVGFCTWCLSSVIDMVIQLQGYDDIEILRERMIELGQEERKN